MWTTGAVEWEVKFSTEMVVQMQHTALCRARDAMCERETGQGVSGGPLFAKPQSRNPKHQLLHHQRREVLRVVLRSGSMERGHVRILARNRLEDVTVGVKIRPRTIPRRCGGGLSVTTSELTVTTHDQEYWRSKIASLAVATMGLASTMGFPAPTACE